VILSFLLYIYFFFLGFVIGCILNRKRGRKRKGLKRGTQMIGGKKQRKTRGRILVRGKVKNQEVFMYLRREAGVAPTQNPNRKV